MDEVIWIELLSRQRNVVARYRCAGRVIRIGRAYTNDVILDDPYVAAEHVSLVRDEGGALVAEDLGSANGLFADHSRRRLDRLVVRDDTPFRVGNSWLRVRRLDHAVAVERIYTTQGRSSWPMVLALSVIVLAVEAATIWLADFAEPRAVDYVVPLLSLVVATVLWAGLWTTASRIFSGQSRLERNLMVALLGVLAFEAWSELSELGAFGFSWSVLVTYRYVGFWCLLGGLVLVQLRLINPAYARLKTGVVLGVLGAAIAVQTLMQFDTRPSFDQAYVRQLQPPALRLSRVEDEAAFFAAVEKLQDELERDRKAEP